MNLEKILGLYAAVSTVIFILVVSFVALGARPKKWWMLPVVVLFWPIVAIKGAVAKIFTQQKPEN